MISSSFFTSRLSLFILLPTILIGTENSDVFVNPKPNTEYIFTEGGKDIVVYDAIKHSDTPVSLDGGKGTDTLILRISPAQFEDPMFRTDMIRYLYFIKKNTHKNASTGNGPEFSFQSFNLNVRNFENVKVEAL